MNRLILARSARLLVRPSSHRIFGGNFLPSVGTQRCAWFSDANNNKSEDPAKAADENVATETETPPPTTEEATTEETKQELTKEQELEAQIKDLKDKLLRSMAEQDNTRRIANRDIDQARQFAIKSFAKSLLEVSDNLELALKAVPEDALQANDERDNSVLATLYEGIQMTEKGLLKAFESNGLVKYGAPGEVFDPNKHEALFEYPDTTKEAGTVGEVMKPGFMLNSRVLRPAEVGVIKKA